MRKMKLRKLRMLGVTQLISGSAEFQEPILPPFYDLGAQSKAEREGRGSSRPEDRQLRGGGDRKSVV